MGKKKRRQAGAGTGGDWDGELVLGLSLQVKQEGLCPGTDGAGGLQLLQAPCGKAVPSVVPSARCPLAAERPAWTAAADLERVSSVAVACWVVLPVVCWAAVAGGCWGG